MAMVNVRTLKDELSDWLRRAEAGEQIIVTRDGKPIAGLVPVAEVQGTTFEAICARMAAKGQMTLPTDTGPFCLEPFAEEGTDNSGSRGIIEDRR